MKNLLPVLVAIGLSQALAHSSSLAGQDWPRFRGPNGAGIVPDANFPISWTDKDYKWQVELPGMGHSSPVVRGNRLFITSGFENSATIIVACRNTADGSVLWQRVFNSVQHRKHKFNAFASSTPALGEQLVYVTWANPEHYMVVALDQKTGQTVWQTDLGPFKAQHGYGSSPIVFQDLVIAANEQDGESSIVALDAATGNIRWKLPRKTVRAAYSTPCVFRSADGSLQLITTSMAHGVSGIEPQSGKLLWELPVFHYRVVSSPVIAGQIIFATAGEGGAGREMVAVRPPASPNDEPKLVARFEEQLSPRVLPYVCTSVSDGQLLFALADAGALSCIEVATAKVLWQEQLNDKFFSSPLWLGDKIYCIARDGTVYVFAATTEPKLLATTELGEETYATPAVAGDVMYIRTFSHLMALPASGSQ